MQLPPWVRQIQQSKLVQLILIPALITAIPTIIQCAGNDFARMSLSCLKLGGSAAVIYIVGMIQHSPGSANFNPSGTPNKQVEEIVAADKAAVPVAVVPVSSPVVRDSIRAAVEEGAKVEVHTRL